MLALFDNLSLPEMLVILVVALLVFGKQLPEVAVRAASQVARARRTLTEMWRQTGLDDELRKVRREIDAEQRRIATKIPDWRKEVPDWKQIENGVRPADGQTVAQPAETMRRLAAEAGTAAPEPTSGSISVATPRDAAPPQVRTTGLVTPPGLREPAASAAAEAPPADAPTADAPAVHTPPADPAPPAAEKAAD